MSPATHATTTYAVAMQVMRLHATLFAENVAQTQSGADEEHVHDARVATRRMRAALRLFSDVLPAEAGDLNSELGWMGSQLGAVRDLDVQIERVRTTATTLDLSEPLNPYCVWLAGRRREAQVAFDAALYSDRFVHLTEALRALNDLPESAETQASVDEDAPPRLKRAYRKLRKRADDLCPDSPPEAFHRARIGAKRLRYAAEFFEPTYGKPARRVIDAATDLQDLLGDHQDSIVHTQRIHDAVAACADTWPPATSLALGQLLQWESQHAQDLRHQFEPTYRKVKSAWKRLRKAF
jgi:CHAD domain-containing protein